MIGGSFYVIQYTDGSDKFVIVDLPSGGYPCPADIVSCTKWRPEARHDMLHYLGVINNHNDFLPKLVAYEVSDMV